MGMGGLAGLGELGLGGDGLERRFVGAMVLCLLRW